MADTPKSGNALWQYIVDRLKEPSTAAGAATALIALLSDIPTAALPPTWNIVVKLIITALGGLAVVTPEKGKR